MKITYLLGAGASVGSLPVVNDISKQIDYVLDKLKGYSNRFNIKNQQLHLQGQSPENNPRKNHLDEALADLAFLKEGCGNHRSIDTFAKMLFLTSDIEERKKDYRRVKCAIILFFELYRAYNRKSDMRYDAFIATIMNNESPRMPDNINIVSWNYDYEFEKAYLKYSPKTADIHDIYNEINVTHKYCSSTNNKQNNFEIVKINGTAGFYNSEGKIMLGIGIQNLTLSDNSNSDKTTLADIFSRYCFLKKSNQHHPAISFSWEEDSKIASTLQSALIGRDMLIIVGYSFPYFNRKIDQQILRGFFNSHQRIIVQDLSEKIHDRLETVSNILSMPVTHIKGIADTDQFYMEF